MRLLQLSLLSLGTGEAKAFGAAVRWGRADLAEVCCSSDSVLSGEVERLGGRTLTPQGTRPRPKTDEFSD